MKGYPEEVRGKGRLLELSPLSTRDALEEQRLAIERHYEEKLESMRREMESRNEQEKAKLQQELEKLRISTPMEIPSVPVGEEGVSLGSPGAEDDPYQVMKSIAFQPLDTNRQRTTSIRIKDITGGGEDVATQSETSDSPVTALRFSSSTSPGVSVHALELPLLSPATGQHNTVSPPTAGSPTDPEMREILQTYEVVESSPQMKHTQPQDMSDFTSSSTFDLGYVNRNMSRFHVESALSASCPQHVMEPHENEQPDGHPVDELEPRHELSAVEQELDGGESIVREGAVWRKRRGDTQKVRNLAKKLSKDVNQLRKEKEEYSAENAELREKLQMLASPQQNQNESVLDYRRRSYAQSEAELSPKARHLRRTHSLGERTARLSFSIDHHYLRGRGFTSYHMYEISIMLGKEKWTVHKRYQDFQRLHDEMRRRYPQLSTLSLPPSRWIGHRSEAFVQQRRHQLQDYMQSLMAVLRYLKNSPLLEKAGRRLTKTDLIALSSFFDDSGSMYATVS
jgi:hypothetical protein